MDESLLSKERPANRISIIGDSISTLMGYNPDGFKIFYDENMQEATGVRNARDTWWGQLVEYCGAELLVNNSWSGSRVTRIPGEPNLFPSGCSNERTGGLHQGSAEPDLIIIYMGINDWANGVPIYGNDETAFLCAYTEMLRKIRRNYPNAKVWCCTLCESYISTNPYFQFPTCIGGIAISEYNKAIKDCAKSFGCSIADLHRYHEPYNTLDGTHPNLLGMNKLSELIIRACGFKKGRATESEVNLYILNTGEVINANKAEIIIGRTPECNILFLTQFVSRRHATLLHNGDGWYIRDNGSTNGTYINGDKLEPMKKYALSRDDVIDIGHEEFMIFSQANDKKSSENIDRSMDKMLLDGIANFIKSGYQSGRAFDVVCKAMQWMPMYLPVNIDVESLLDGIDIESVKAGDSFSLSKETSFKVLPLRSENAVIVPIFSSNTEVKKGPPTSVMKFYPVDYLPMLISMKLDAVINPFGNRLIISKDLLKKIFHEVIKRKEAIEISGKENAVFFKKERNTDQNVKVAPDIERELQEVYRQSESPPRGNQAASWHWLSGKILFFEQNQVPSGRLLGLKTNMLLQLSDYYCTHVENFLSVAGSNAPILYAEELLLQAGEIEGAIKIANPYLEYIKRHIINSGSNLKCFQNELERNIYKQEFGLDSVYDETDDNYTYFLVLYSKILDNVLATTVSDLEEQVKCKSEMLNIAVSLSPCNASAWRACAALYGQEPAVEEKYNDCIERALRYAQTKKELGEAYANLALHYSTTNATLANALCILSENYGSAPNAAKIIINKASNALKTQDCEAIVANYGIQVGFSQIVKQQIEQMLR